MRSILCATLIALTVAACDEGYLPTPVEIPSDTVNLREPWIFGFRLLQGDRLIQQWPAYADTLIDVQAPVLLERVPRHVALDLWVNGSFRDTYTSGPDPDTTVTVRVTVPPELRVDTVPVYVPVVDTVWCASAGLHDVPDSVVCGSVRP